MYLHSTEIRWFFQGPLLDGDPLIRWFAKPLVGYGHESEELLDFESDTAPTELGRPGRIDAYLMMEGAKTVGAKVRGGADKAMFEIKAQVSAPTVWGRDGLFGGCVDSWVKWSVKHDALKSAIGPMQETGRWVRIAKERWLRKISADGSRPRFVAANQKSYRSDHEDVRLRRLPIFGCNAELTRLFVGDDRSDSSQAWHTICLEAFAPHFSMGPPTLAACVDLFFGEFGPPPSVKLDGQSSTNYPEWLEELRKAG